MLTLRNFSIGYSERRLLADACCSFPSASLTALVGRNGSGKSTLLRALAGLNHRYEGEIMVNDKNIRHLSPMDMAKLIAFVNTERTRIPNLRCRDVVAMGRAPYTDWIGRLRQEDETQVERALSLTGMLPFANRTMDSMSDGECQRVMIARALAQDTPIILLDEPTSFLDLPNRHELAELLLHLAHDEHKCIIFSTHELDLALRLTDHIALLADATLTLLPSSFPATRQRIRTAFSLPTL